MNKVKRNLDNQAIGLVPLLLFMFLDNYFSYLLSFIIGVTFCFVCIFLFQILSKDKAVSYTHLRAHETELVGSGIGVFRVCQANNIAANPDVSASDLQADIDAYYVK